MEVHRERAWRGKVTINKSADLPICWWQLQDETSRRCRQREHIPDAQTEINPKVRGKVRSFSLLTREAGLDVGLNILEQSGPVVWWRDFHIGFEAGIMTSENTIVGLAQGLLLVLFGLFFIVFGRFFNKNIWSPW